MSWIVNHDAEAIKSIIVEWECPRCGSLQKSEVYGNDISYLEAYCQNEICGNNSKLVLWNAEPEISYKSQSDVPLKEAQ